MQQNSARPKTIAEAVDWLVANLPEETLHLIRGMRQFDYTPMHFGLGAWVRSNLGLFDPSKELLRSCETDEPDNASAIILEALWNHLVRNASAEALSKSRQIREAAYVELERQKQERLNALAAKDAAITDKRCPHCGRPCPSYRKTCKYCRKAVTERVVVDVAGQERQPPLSIGFPKMPDPLPVDESWPNGDAFIAVLRAVDELWMTQHQMRESSRDFRFLLIEQWSSNDSGEVAGEVIASWIANAERLHRISDAERVAHLQYVRYQGSGIFPFVLVQFWVSDDHRKVSFGTTFGSRSGFGCEYRVERDSVGPVLVQDPNGGQWIS